MKPEAVTEETEEGRKIVKVKSPMVVTKEVREDHEKTHTPYRSWCKWCVWARSKNFPHKRKTKCDKDDKPAVPRICMGYFFMPVKTSAHQITHA